MLAAVKVTLFKGRRIRLDAGILPPCPRKARERGTAIVEFTFVVIPTLVLVCMSANLAWILFGWACLQSAVREGVRYGITGPVTTGMDSAIDTFVTTMSVGFINSNNNPTIKVQYYSPTTYTEVTGQSGATQAGNVLKVTATISLQSLLPVWSSSGKFGGTFTSWAPTLTAASADVLETSTPPPAE